MLKTQAPPNLQKKSCKNEMIFLLDKLYQKIDLNSFFFNLSHFITFIVERCSIRSWVNTIWPSE